MAYVWDWKKFFYPHRNAFDGISKPHEFLIVNGDKGEFLIVRNHSYSVTDLPVMWYKQYTTDEHYFGENMSRVTPIKLLNSMPDSVPESVAPEEFDEEMLKKVYSLFIIQHN